MFAVLIFLNLASVFSSAQTSPSAQSNKASSTSVQAAPAGNAVAEGSGVQAAPEDESDDNDSADIPAFVRGRISEKDYLRMREEHLGMKRGVNDLARDPQARSRAVRAMRAQEDALRKKALSLGVAGPALLSGPTWTPLGPAPIPNGQVQNSGTEVPVSGRVTAIAIDPTDSTGNTVYVGAASGGVYRSLDGGATWTPLMDSANSLAIGAITIDPMNHNTVFVGTGEGNFALDSFFGVGLYVITNATTTPVLSGPFNSDGGTGDVFTGRAITQILVNPSDDNKILVSTSSGFSGASSDIFNVLPTRGVYLSTNAQSATPTFTRLTVQTTANTNLPVTDMVMDPGNPNLVVINIFSITGTEGGIWTSPNTVWAGTGTWTQTLQTGQQVNGKLAVNRSGSPTPTTTFFAGLDQKVSGGSCNGKEGTLFQAANNGGSAWTEIMAGRGFCGGQCFYDITLAVDPTTTQTIYLGGSADNGAVACGTNTFAKSTNGGTSFARSDVQLHADSHATAILPSNPSIIYEGNDGGIFRSNDGGTTWSSLNATGFNATQFESIAVHPVDPNFTIGGTQDNGTPMMLPNGNWTRVDFGDGGFSAIDSNATNTTNVVMYHTYFNASNNLIGYAEAEDGVNANENTSWGFSGCSNPPTTGNGITCADTTLFYAPLTLGPGNPNTVYFGTDRLYRSPDKGNTNTVVSQAPLVTGVAISAIGISPQDDNVRIVGLQNGRVFATTSGSSTLVDVTGPLPVNKYVARAVIDPNNPNTAYVTFDGYGVTAGHIWKTVNLSNATPTWTSVSVGIPDVPVNGFIVDPHNSNILYAGTDIGVFASTDAGLTFAPYGMGLPRVPVFDLKVSTKPTLRIATHGRGMWEIAPISAGFSTTTAASANPTSASVGATVTLSASVAHTLGSAVPTGTVAFLDGNNPVGSAPLNGSAVASLSTSFQTGGTHSITASYGGDSNYAASQGTTSVSVSDFSITIPNGSQTVKAGQPATYTINTTTAAGFAGTVSFTCTTGLPSLTSCSFNPTTVTNSGSTTLTISTTAPTSAPKSPNLGSSLMKTSGLFALGLVLAGSFAVKKRRHSLLLLVIVLAMAAALVSCGGGGSSVTHSPGTPAGTSTVTVTATSGSTTHSATVTLTVQ
jgi:hypothetical protein